MFVLFVATVGPAAGFVLSAEIRGWIGDNGYLVFWCAFAICLLLVVALELQRREIDADSRDIELADRFRHALGADGTLITWVRNDFAPNRFSQERWHSLERLHLTWSDDDARRFRDKKVQVAYKACMDALAAFMSRVGDDTWPRDTRENDPGMMGLPPEWTATSPEMRGRWQKAVDEIAEARSAFLVAHANFLKKAHDRGL